MKNDTAAYPPPFEHAIRGVVTGFNEQNNCFEVELVDGKHGTVLTEEVARAPRHPNYYRGKRLMFFVLGEKPDGTYQLSARRYEEYELECIKHGFESKTVNIYNGKLAFKTPYIIGYHIGQASVVAVSLKRFSRVRLPSFDCIDVPHEIQVTISRIMEDGRIEGTTIPSLGDFKYNVHKMGLREGDFLYGMVTGHMATGSLVAIAPAVIAAIEEDVPLHQAVKIYINKIDVYREKVRAKLVKTGSDEEFSYRKIRFSNFVHDLDCNYYKPEFQPKPLAEVGNSAKAEAKSSEAESADEEPSDEEIPAKDRISPFSVREGETVRFIRQEEKNRSPNAIHYYIERGILTDADMQLVRGINEFKYMTPLQMERLLSLYREDSLTRNRLNKMLSRLCALNILGALEFATEQSSSLYKVYYPGYNYFKYTGETARFGANSYISPVSVIKGHLSANNLTLSILTGIKNREGKLPLYAIRPVYRNDRVVLRPKARIESAEHMLFMESLRGDCENINDLVEKLTRYNAYFSEQKLDKPMIVYIVLEAEEAIESVKKTLEKLCFPFELRLTHDRAVLDTEPSFVSINAHRENKNGKGRLLGLLSRVIGVV